MAIAWRTDYALRLMYETACLGEGGMASVTKLAERAGVPYDFARQIANRLAHEGLLVSRRGSKGGFALARPADEITCLEVFQAMDEAPSMSLCNEEANLCARVDVCPMHHAIWLPLDRVIVEHLAGLSLAEAVLRGKRLERELSRSAH